MRGVGWMGVVAAMSALGCGGGTTTPLADAGAEAGNDVATSVDTGPGVCVPDRATWDTTILGHVTRQCGACHGAAPQFGSPYSLLDYDANLAGAVGSRRVDRMAVRLMAGTMPPAGTPAPTDAVNAALVQWATCGAQTPMPGQGLRASAPVFRSPERSPEGLSQFELRADNFPVPPTVRDRYQCFTFTAPVQGPRFIKRFEMILENPEVIHHLVLLRDPQGTAPTAPFQCNSMPDGSEYLYAWAPGQNAFEFPEGGLRVEPGHRFVVQLHYNNSVMRENVVDRSGVRIYHGPAEGTEYGMVAIGPVAFNIPARSQATASSACTLRAGSRMLAGMPHMHEVGTGFEQSVRRGNGMTTPIISLQGWRFETELFYELPVTLAEGDRIMTSCTFNNPTSSAVRSGSRTSDEMCFNFAYVTPPPLFRFCDEAVNVGPDLAYTPGMCAAPAATRDLPLAQGRVIADDPPALEDGTIPPGRWELANVNYYVDTIMTGAGMLNLAESSMSGRGQMWTEAGRMVVDFNTSLVLVIGAGIRFAREIPLSFAGNTTVTGTDIAVQATCPANGSGAPTALQFGLAAGGTELTVGLRAQETAGVRITPRYTFRRAN